ncbi:MAG: tyrosine-type recombinase/integrase [Gammaproteobacteria bacterium]
MTGDALISSVWDPALIVRLLEAVDRSSSKGKKDYAILLLAYRLGLRLGNIRTLTLDNLNWEAATIEITQSKTRVPLCLPLTEEVGTASRRNIMLSHSKQLCLLSTAWRRYYT